MTDFNLVLSQVRQRLEILYQIVDELEAQGGGGGGTTDYTDLDNKPKINNVTLSGNKTGADLGLASSSDISTAIGTAIAGLDVAEVGGSTYFLTTISETDGKISATATPQSTVLSNYLTTSDAASTYQSLSGMSNYYTKTETESKITDGINALDAAAVGGTGKYIKAISETNGVISATEETLSTTPTSESAVAITSGAVYPIWNGLATIVDENYKVNVLENSATTTTVGNEVEFVVNADGSITATVVAAGGTSQARAISWYATLPAGTWMFNTNQALSGAYPAPCYAYLYTSETIALDYGDRRNFTLDEDTYLRCYITIRTGQPQGTTFTFYPMVCRAEWYAVSNKYVPYVATSALTSLSVPSDMRSLNEIEEPEIIEPDER